MQTKVHNPNPHCLEAYWTICRQTSSQSVKSRTGQVTD